MESPTTVKLESERLSAPSSTTNETGAGDTPLHSAFEENEFFEVEFVPPGPLPDVDKELDPLMTAIKEEPEDSDEEMNSSLLSLKQKIEKSGNKTEKKNAYKKIKIVPLKETSSNEIKIKKSKINKCNECNITFRCEIHLKEHNFRLHNGEKPHECNLCEKKFTNKFNLESHKFVHSEKQHECDVCYKKFYNLSDMKDHVSVHMTDNNSVKSEPTINKCEACDEIFKSEELFKEHNYYVHDADKPYECQLCQKKFTSKSNLRSHRFAHMNAKPHECKLCNMKFKRLYGLQSHNKHVHKETVTETPEMEALRLSQITEYSHECSTCHEKFNFIYILRRHEKREHSKKGYDCYICTKKFKYLSLLKKHEFDVHIGKPQFECNICKKKFRWLRSLSRHKLIHIGLKPYACSICPKRFRELGNLKKHEFAHNNEKATNTFRSIKDEVVKNAEIDGDSDGDIYHEENVKDDENSTESSVNGSDIEPEIIQTKSAPNANQPQVILARSGRKRYRCSICLRIFKVEGRFKEHNFRFHNEDMPYACDICHRKFVKKDSLKSHKFTHTSERLHRCMICQKKFKELSNLKQHYRKIHAGREQYECNICQQKFVNLFNMKCHRFIHLTERTSNCKNCVKCKESSGVKEPTDILNYSPVSCEVK